MKMLRRIVFFVMSCMLAVMSAQQITVGAVGDCSAKAAVVYDPVSGEFLYEKNADTRLPMASTTKIMSALIALESGNLDEQFTVDPEAIKNEGSSMGLREGDKVTMRGLVCGMLLPSGNDAANAAAVRCMGSIEKFVDEMNRRAEQMGLRDTHFVTPSGLDDDTEEHFSTARDMAKLAAAALENEDFAAICSQKYIKLEFGNPPEPRWLTNSNKLLGSCEGVIGVKTGFTDKARRCLVSACERDGARLICVTLNDPDDWRDHSALYDSAFAQMQTCVLKGSGKLFTVKAAGGTADEFSAACRQVSMALPVSAADKVKCEYRVKKFAFAPVKCGEKVGEAVFYIGGREIAREPITAGEDVAQAPSDKEDNGWHGFFCELEKLLD